jgi:putative endonuclease
MSQTNRHNKNLGDKGEEIVKLRYIKEGWSLLNEKVTYRNSELDLVFVRGETILFVEVKTIEWGNQEGLRPEDNFTYSKQKHLKRGVEAYLFKNKVNMKSIQIDLACVTHDGSRVGESGEWRIKIFPNIILE